MEYKKKPKKQKGVTLIGVLVGITILSIALAAQIRLLGNTIRRDAELRSLIVATNLAREGIEILFSWRVTKGWEELMGYKNNSLCADIRLDKSNGGECLTSKLDYVSYTDGGDIFSEFKAYLYGPGSTEFDVPPFWRAMAIKSCDPPADSQCLILVATSGWENCSPSDWQNCVNSADGQCTCKLVKLEKKIYNWYVP
ncbi:MAG: prepilin-type N-terminal cleavage/methylation domain-containing protein [Candidatus Moraniibacteriota bacterium]